VKGLVTGAERASLVQRARLEWRRHRVRNPERARLIPQFLESAETRFDILLSFDEIRVSLVTPTKPDDYVEGILEGTNDAYYIEC
jgi:hypothetical protein